MSWSAISAISARQFSLISRAQARAAGVSDQELDWAVAEGHLTRKRHGVYAVVGAPVEHQPLMAACLAAGETAAVSHMAAARLWGAEQVLAGRIEITTFDNRDHRLPGIVTHRSRLDPTRAITRHLDLPVVVPALAVVQVTNLCGPYLVKSIANDLVKRHWTSFPEIREWIEVAGIGGRQGLRELCLQAIEVGGHDDSPPARELCHRLLGAGAPRFRTDYVVQTPGGILLIDIAWPRSKVGIEYNGARDHANNPLARIDDTRRLKRLRDLGWTILVADKSMSQHEIVEWALTTLAAKASS